MAVPMSPPHGGAAAAASTAIAAEADSSVAHTSDYRTAARHTLVTSSQQWRSCVAVAVVVIPRLRQWRCHLHALGVAQSMAHSPQSRDRRTSAAWKRRAVDVTSVAVDVTLAVVDVTSVAVDVTSVAVDVT